MRIRILRPAADELDDAVNYYECEQPGLGQRLWLEVDALLHWVTENSTLPRLRPGGYRRVNLKVFPYYIAYSVSNEGIVVWAISNAHRKPEYWIDRLK